MSKSDPPSIRPPKLHKALSLAGDDYLDQMSLAIETDLASSVDHDFPTLRTTRHWTSFLPDHSGLSDDFKEYLEKDLYQTDHLKWLCKGQNSAVNFDSTASKLMPLKTQGDGNCLLHAASLSLWGIHDRDLVLRGALRRVLTGKHAAGFKARWAAASKLEMKDEPSWRHRWVELVDQTSLHMKKDNQSGAHHLEFLEQLHIFVLAHILRRPIIVYADNVLYDSGGNALYQLSGSEAMSGIYLPLELASAAHTSPARLLSPSNSSSHRSPLAFSFHGSHFAALVSIGNKKAPAVQDNKVAVSEDNEEETAWLPLTDHQGKLMNIHFLLPSDGFPSSILSPPAASSSASSSSSSTPATPVPAGQVANVRYPAVPADVHMALSRWLDLGYTSTGLLVCKQTARLSPTFRQMWEAYLKQSESKVAELAKKKKAAAEVKTGPCVGIYGVPGLGAKPSNYRGCDFMGSSTTLGMCSSCHKDYLTRKAAIDAKDKPPRIHPLLAAAWEKGATAGPCVAGCGFNGLASRDKMCSKCHPAFLIARAKEQASTPSAPPPTPPAVPLAIAAPVQPAAAPSVSHPSANFFSDFLSALPCVPSPAVPASTSSSTPSLSVPSAPTERSFAPPASAIASSAAPSLAASVPEAQIRYVATDDASFDCHPHPLKYFATLPSGHWCNICRATITSSARRCVPCDFDVCGNCLTHQRLSIAEPRPPLATTVTPASASIAPVSVPSVASAPLVEPSLSASLTPSWPPVPLNQPQPNAPIALAPPAVPPVSVPSTAAPPAAAGSAAAKPCEGGCGFTGNPVTLGFCSMCFKLLLTDQ